MNTSPGCVTTSVCWQCHVLEQVRQDVSGAHRTVADASRRRDIHLAVFAEPFLQFMLDGIKTVESRFSVNDCAPYRRVSRGDVVLVKQAAGPIVAAFEVGHVWSYRLEPGTWDEIRRRFAKALCADDPLFWDARKHATFATLMTVKNLQRITPILCGKRDRRGWVVLHPSGQDELFTKS